MSTATATPTTFTIVADSVLIVPCNERDPLAQKAIHGSVAWLPSRQQHVARSGIALAWSYWRWDDRLNRAGDLLAAPVNSPSQFQARLETVGGTHELWPVPTNNALFLPGKVMYSRRPPVVAWASYAARHCVGDYGLLGAYDSEPLSTEEVWSHGLLDASRSNDASIQLGVGAVRSEFELTADDAELWRRHIKPSWDQRNHEQDLRLPGRTPDPLPAPLRCHIITLIGQRTLLYLA
jgi:hypothetical protein